MKRDTGSSENAVAIDVSVSDQVLPLGTRAIYVGGTGNLAVVMRGGATLTYENVAPGYPLAIDVGTVLNGGTTATGLIAMF